MSIQTMAGGCLWARRFDGAGHSSARHEGARAASFMVAGNPGSFDPYAYLGQSIVIPTEPRSAFATLKAHF